MVIATSSLAAGQNLQPSNKYIISFSYQTNLQKKKKKVKKQIVHVKKKKGENTIWYKTNY